MSKSLRPVADLKARIGSYTDKEGKEKGRYVKVGTLFSSPHGSHQAIKMDSMPISADWDGWVSVFPKDDESAPVAQEKEEASII